jgi:hypothetical protein
VFFGSICVKTYFAHMFKTFCREFLFCLLVCLSASIAANNPTYVSWYRAEDSVVLRLDLSSGDLDVFSNEISRFSEAFTLNYDPEVIYSRESAIAHPTTDGLKVTLSGSGQVFKVSFRDSTISRLDGTYQHGYNFDALQFQRDGVIYSYGGYGFWMENNLLTRFDEVAKEWFYESSPPFPVEIESPHYLRHLRWYDKQEDNLYVGNGSYLYCYSFRKKDWKNLGRLNADITRERSVHLNMLNDSTALFYDTERHWIIHWRSNRIEEISLSGKEDISPKSGIKGIHCMYANGEEFVAFKASNKVGSGFFRTSLRPSEWTVIETDRMYTPMYLHNILIYSPVALGTLLFILLLRYLLLKRKRRRSDWLAYLTPSDRLLVNALRIGDLDTEEVNRVLDLENLGWEVQRRKRSETIKSINAFANKALGFDIIERHKSPTDKRQVIYRLNQALK